MTHTAAPAEPTAAQPKTAVLRARPPHPCAADPPVLDPVRRSVNVIAPQLEVVGELHAAPMAPADAPSMIAMKRMPAVPAHDSRPPQAERDRHGDTRQGRRRRAGALGRSLLTAVAITIRQTSRSSSWARPSRRSWSSRGDGWSMPRRAPAGRSGSARGAPGTARSPTGARRSRRSTCSAAACSTSAPRDPTRFASR